MNAVRKAPDPEPAAETLEPRSQEDSGELSKLHSLLYGTQQQFEDEVRALRTGVQPDAAVPKPEPDLTSVPYSAPYPGEKSRLISRKAYWGWAGVTLAVLALVCEIVFWPGRDAPAGREIRAAAAKVTVP